MATVWELAEVEGTMACEERGRVPFRSSKFPEGGLPKHSDAVCVLWLHLFSYQLT